MTLNAYIHIPFCSSKCKYCSFTSFTNLELIQPYIYSLLKEIEVNYEGEPLNTLYFGGGTPSLLSSNQLKKIINKFNFASSAEITFEINPSDVTEDYINSLLDLGINRLSLGVQSFDDNILTIIGRRHNSQIALNSIEIISNYFDNFSIDFIYGLPSQNIESFNSDLLKAISLNIPHISLYGLKIEPNSYFYSNTPINLPDDDMQADMYLLASSLLSDNNYNRYEISNFAKSGFESKHNLNYWNNNTYYGFGVSAHGYIDGIRYNNTSLIQDYIDNPRFHEYGKELTTDEILQEEIFLGFRKGAGIDINSINTKFAIDFDTKYKSTIQKYLDANLLEKTDVGYKLNTNGFLLSNMILSEFL